MVDSDGEETGTVLSPLLECLNWNKVVTMLVTDFESDHWSVYSQEIHEINLQISKCFGGNLLNQRFFQFAVALIHHCNF